MVAASQIADIDLSMVMDAEKEMLQDDTIKSKLVMFFRLCDTNKNGRVTWNEFRSHRQQYSYQGADEEITTDEVEEGVMSLTQ